jgi:hypothetical protein
MQILHNLRMLRFSATHLRANLKRLGWARVPPQW